MAITSVQTFQEVISLGELPEKKVEQSYTQANRLAGIVQTCIWSRAETQESDLYKEAICEIGRKIVQIKSLTQVSDTTILEQQIDNLVFKLYDLTFEEVKVVDPAFALSEEEYNNIVIE